MASSLAVANGRGEVLFRGGGKLFALVGLIFGLLIWPVAWGAADAAEEETAGAVNGPVPAGLAVDGPARFTLERLFDGRGGRNIAVAEDGTVLLFHRQQVYRSTDGGERWSTPLRMGQDSGGNVVVDEETGDILFVRPEQGMLWRSSDHGQSWQEQQITIVPDGFGHGDPDTTPAHAGAMQPGITLRSGEHRGRLLMPARVFGPQASNDPSWWPYHYNTAMYSDDRGKTWHMSAPFPVLGTGEAALAERRDGMIYYNSREHLSKGNRYIAWSDDGGVTWKNPSRCAFLPDGMRGDRYGCMGGLVRLPMEDQDVFLYSNLDADGGAFRGRDRQSLTVWASFDGGKTWPAKRLVFPGPSAYSSLAVGRPGTASEGWIYLFFEGGERHSYEGVYLARFNLAWLLAGADDDRTNNAE